MDPFNCLIYCTRSSGRRGLRAESYRHVKPVDDIDGRRFIVELKDPIDDGKARRIELSA